MPKNAEQKAFDVSLSEEKRGQFTEWLCRELQSAIDNRPVNILDVRYWWTLYEQGRTRGESAPWQDAADLTSYLITEKVDALRSRIMRTVFVDPIYTVEGWGKSANKAPFVEDFHQWAAESEGLQSFVGRAVHSSLIEPRGVLEVFEDTTERVTRKTINAAVVTTPDPVTGQPVWVMDGETQQPALQTDESGRYVEVLDAMTPSAQVTIDETERVRKGPGYRVLSYEHFAVLPGHAREKADIYGYAKWFTKRIDQLKEAAKQGMYDAEAIEALHTGPDLASDLSVSGEQVPVTNTEGPTVEKELWEIQLLYNLDGKGLRWYVVTVHLPSRTLLRLKYDDINKGRFILLVPFPRTDRAHEGYSFAGNKLITVTEEHTAWRNMGADRAALEISAPVKRLTTALWEPDLQPMGPRSVIDVRDMNEVQPMQIPPQTDAALKREQECVNASERIAGINDVALGQSSQQSQTLGELEIRTEQSFVRMDEVIKNLQEPLEELGQIRNAIWIRTLQQCEQYDKGGYGVPAGVTQRLPGRQQKFIPQNTAEGLDERGGDPTKDSQDPVGVTSDMLMGTFRFKPRGSTETADRSKLRTDYVQGLQALAILFQTWPILAQLVGSNSQAAMSAVENWLRLFNIPDKQAWLGPLQQMQQQAAANPGMGMPMPPGMPGAPPGGAGGLPPGLPPQIQQLIGGGGAAPPPQQGA